MAGFLVPGVPSLGAGIPTDALYTQAPGDGQIFTDQVSKTMWVRANGTWFTVSGTPEANDNIEGLPLYGYGNSYLVPAPSIAQRRYIDRIAGRISTAAGLSVRVAGIPPTIDTNKGVNGALAADVANYAYGTVTALNATSPLVAVAGTWAVGDSNGGVVLLDVGRNDAGYDGTTSTSGTTAKSRQGYYVALDALVRLFQAKLKIEDPAAGNVVYSGVWTHNTAQTHNSGGTYSNTSAAGASVTITTAAGTDFDLIVLGNDDADTITGATFTVTVDGVNVPNPQAGTGGVWTISNQMRTTTSVGDNLVGTSTTQMAVPLRNLTNAVHTIVLTKDNVGGTTLFFDCVLQKSKTPPTVVIMKTPQIIPLGYSAYVTNGGLNASFAVDQVYNSIVDQVVANFPTPGEVVSFDPNSPSNPYGLWVPTTMISSVDGIHPNDLGSAYYADNILTILNALPYRAGMVSK